MFPFYNNMKKEIINCFSRNNRPELYYTEIVEFESYKNAPPEYTDDFDGTILGSLSRSVSKPKTLAKSMNSSFSSFFSNDDETPIIEPNDHHPTIETLTNDQRPKFSNNPIIKFGAYQSTIVDSIDSLIA